MNTAIEISIRITILAALGWAASGFLRRRASARHAVWTAVLAGMLCMPLVHRVLPDIPLRLLPNREQPITQASPIAPIPSAPMNAVSAPAHSPADTPTGNTGVAIYIAGVCLLAFRLAAALRRRSLLIERATPVDNREASIPGLAGVRLFESDEIVVPVVTGWRPAKILLPSSWREWDRARFEAVLAHEIAHICRGDQAIATLAAVNKILFWFHPAAWWVERQIAAAAEEAADDAALAVVDDRGSYAATLLHMASALRGRNARVTWGEAAMASSSRVGARIRRFLDDDYRVAGTAPAPLRIAFAAASVVVFILTSAVTIESRVSAQVDPIRPAAVLTQEAVSQMEEQLRQYPKDLVTRTRLIEHYRANGRTDDLTAHVSWLIRNAPAGARFGKLPAEVNASTRDLWTAAVREHPHDVNVLVNVGWFFQQSGDFKYAEGCFKRARMLQPEEPKHAGSLVNLYGAAIAGLERASSYFPEQGAAANAIAERVKADLLGTNDAEVVGGVGRHLATLMRQPLEGTTWKDRDLPLRLLSRAARLAPDDARWKSEIAAIHTPEARASRMITGTPMKPVQMVPPVYPPLARQARVQGTVSFNVLVAEDGSVENVELISGHQLLVPAASEAVKQWKFSPSKLNGQPVKARTIAQVPFEVVAAGSGSESGSFRALQTLLPRHGSPLVAGQSKDQTIELRFDVDSSSAPVNIRISHPEAATPFALEVAKNAERLRYQPASGSPYPVWIKLTWRPDGIISVDASHDAISTVTPR